MTVSELLSLLDFSGVAVGAFGGVLDAKRHPGYRFDFIGVLGLAMVSAISDGSGSRHPHLTRSAISTDRPALSA